MSPFVGAAWAAVVVEIRVIFPGVVEVVNLLISKVPLPPAAP